MQGHISYDDGDVRLDYEDKHESSFGWPRNPVPFWAFVDCKS